jgi:hypothetical protein
MRAVRRGDLKWHRYAWPKIDGPNAPVNPSNPLHEFFENHKEGRGIWNWTHYFEVYDRHFSRFRGREVNVLEIGIYCGGSLEMWKHYFGGRAKIYGVDIQLGCKAYEEERVRVFIGDQADRNFWKRFKLEVAAIDIVIDDGSHVPEHQIVTLEELLPDVRPGGVYVCEDVHDPFGELASYVQAMSHNLNAFEGVEENPADDKTGIVCAATPLQSAIHSIHFYPYVVVIEKRESLIRQLAAPKHGTQWQPFTM